MGSFPSCCCCCRRRRRPPPLREARLPAAGPRSDADFSLDGLELRAAFVGPAAVDGDTLRLRVRPWGPAGPQVQFLARLAGIDAPELHPPKGGLCHAEGREREVAAARAARDALTALAARGAPLGLTAACGKFDKYGRLLVRLSAPGAGDFAAALLAAGHAVPYAGGKKPTFVPR